MNTIDLEIMKWPIIKKTLEDGFGSVVIPVGVDANKKAETLARETGHTMLAPYLITMALKQKTIDDILEDYIDGYVHHGYKTITVVFNDEEDMKLMSAVVEKAKQKFEDTEILMEV